MPFTTAIPAIWVHTADNAFNTLRPAGYAAFLSAAQQARLERIRQARLLFDGEHRTYFLDEGRTQFDFPRVRTGNSIQHLYLTYNVLGLISLKGADLLCGQLPLIRAEDPRQQHAISQLIERSNLPALLYSCALDASYEGECFLEACLCGGESHLRQVPADELFPIGSPRPDGQYEAYQRLRIRNVGTDEAPVHLMLEVIYRPGRIERRCCQVDARSGMRREVPLCEWTAHDADPSVEDGFPPPAALSPLTLTGLDVNTITWIPNLLVRGKPASDFDGAIDLQDALNAKNSQLGRVLLKHSDPKMAVPEELFDAEGKVRMDHDVFAYNDPNRVPQYLSWDAQLEHAMTDRNFVLNQLLIRTETSPSLLGLKPGAAPDAYKKVRLESFNSLSKAARKSVYWRSGIRRAVITALALQRALTGESFPLGAIGVELRDGIPMDAAERAERLATLHGAGLMSLERALEEQLEDPAAVAKELARLRDV